MIKSYSPTQGEFENPCSRLNDTRVMGICLCHIEAIVCDRSFFTDSVSVCSEKGGRRKTLPSNGLPY